MIRTELSYFYRQFANNYFLIGLSYKSYLKFNAFKILYFEAKFKEKVHKVSKILKNLQKVPTFKLPGP